MVPFSKLGTPDLAPHSVEAPVSWPAGHSCEPPSASHRAASPRVCEVSSSPWGGARFSRAGGLSGAAIFIVRGALPGHRGNKAQSGWVGDMQSPWELRGLQGTRVLQPLPVCGLWLVGVRVAPVPHLGGREGLTRCPCSCQVWRTTDRPGTWDQTGTSCSMGSRTRPRCA